MFSRQQYYEEQHMFKPNLPHFSKSVILSTAQPVYTSSIAILFFLLFRSISTASLAQATRCPLFCSCKNAKDAHFATETGRFNTSNSSYNNNNSNNKIISNNDSSKISNNSYHNNDYLINEDVRTNRPRSSAASADSKGRLQTRRLYTVSCQHRLLNYVTLQTDVTDIIAQDTVSL